MHRQLEQEVSISIHYTFVYIRETLYSQIRDLRFNLILVCNLSIVMLTILIVLNAAGSVLASGDSRVTLDRIGR